jgi:predicted transcriptional regulator
MSLTSSDLFKTKEKIVRFFRTNWQNCYSPKMVASKLNLNYNTVKNYVIQLSREGYLLRLQRGLYQWGGRLTQKQIEKIMAEHIPLFHAIQYVIKGGEGVRMTFPKNPFLSLGMDYKEPVDWQVEEGTILCTIGSTDNPLTPMEAISFNSWLIGYFDGCEIEVRNIGINRDLPGIKLEGIQCVTIREFDNVLYRSYNKGNSLRIEHHYSGSVNLTDVLKIEFEFYKLFLKSQNKSRPVPNLSRK